MLFSPVRAKAPEKRLSESRYSVLLRAFDGLPNAGTLPGESRSFPERHCTTGLLEAAHQLKYSVVLRSRFHMVRTTRKFASPLIMRA
jgi:hypothetical protein